MKTKIQALKKEDLKKELLKKNKKTKTEKKSDPKNAWINDVTDMALFVKTSSEDIEDWNIDLIAQSLMKETGVSQKVAVAVAKSVEKKIFKGKIKNVTSKLIRELVNAELVERGLEEARKRYIRLGFPVYDVHQIIENETNKDNANVPHGPEATNLTLAEGIKKEYALLRIFSQDVGDAHLKGDIHLHDLGMIDRPYCSGQSLEYVKRYGLDLNTSLSQARPAKHAEVLIGHLVKFSAALQCHFSGAIGWDAINVFLAPYLTGKTKKELKQLAQVLIYEFSQQSVARGGQAIFSDLNIYWEIPKHFREVEAIGPGGRFTGKKYKDYEKESKAFATAMFEVYLDGDASGMPFFFPKPLVHITEDFFKTSGYKEFLRLISEVAAEKGNTYFVFDRRNEAKISECCRLSFKLEKSDIEDAKTPWKMRYSAIQNISLNLPRLAYLSGGSDDILFSNMNNLMEIVAKAHREKRIFIESLLEKKQRGPLGLLSIEKPDDEYQYLRMHRVTHLIGLVGLNELVQAHIGEELHESRRALKFGLKVVAQLNLLCKKMSQRYGLNFVLEQTPAETTSYRFAKLDLKWHPREAFEIVKGSVDRGEIYYTNSTQVNVSAPLDPIERIKTEGLFHPMIDAGSITHIWLGESKPSAKSVANLVEKCFRNSEVAQVALSPEFTHCNECGKTERGAFV
ncbi:MAG: anaerobic ribonucleoside-triphosphate reductase [Candidatus Moranbacteria bacterium]|nr:anaerobic ribonucleoside-triphosphate reductase [Candidatus Moranbacteria bacterium]